MRSAVAVAVFFQGWLWSAPAAADRCEDLARLIEERIEATRGTDDTDDPRIREALNQIAGMARRQGVRARVAATALASPDAGIRHAATLTLVSIGGDATYPYLVTALGDSEPFVVATALDGLARIGGSSALDRVREFARDPRDIVRSAAARILVRLDPEMRDAPVGAEATEVHALRVLEAAKRGDGAGVRAFLHPLRRIEVVEEEEVRGFLLRSATHVAIAREVLPPLRRAAALVESLRCGPQSDAGIAACVVTDRVGYSIELHFARLLDRLYLFRIRRHGGVPQI